MHTLHGFFYWYNIDRKNLRTMKPKLTRHHKKCRANGGTDEPENISMLPEKYHTSWHTLFKTYDAHTIARLINKFYLDPAFEFIVVPKKQK